MHNKHMLILRMSATLAIKSCDSRFRFMHVPIKLQTLITFAYGIQRRRILVRWALLSNSNKNSRSDNNSTFASALPSTLGYRVMCPDQTWAENLGDGTSIWAHARGMIGRRAARWMMSRKQGRKKGERKKGPGLPACLHQCWWEEEVGQ